jgi:hypothetical protein
MASVRMNRFLYEIRKIPTNDGYCCRLPVLTVQKSSKDKAITYFKCFRGFDQDVWVFLHAPFQGGSNDTIDGRVQLLKPER